MLDWEEESDTAFNIGICPTCGNHMSLSSMEEDTLECDDIDCDTKVPLFEETY